MRELCAISIGFAMLACAGAGAFACGTAAPRTASTGASPPAPIATTATGDDGIVKIAEPNGTPMRDVDARVSAFKPAMRRTAIVVFVAFFGAKASKPARK